MRRLLAVKTRGPFTFTLTLLKTKSIVFTPWLHPHLLTGALRTCPPPPGCPEQELRDRQARFVQRGCQAAPQPSSPASRPSRGLIRAGQPPSHGVPKTRAAFSGLLPAVSRLLGPRWAPGPCHCAAEHPTFGACKATAGCYGHRVCCARGSGRAHLNAPRSGRSRAARCAGPPRWHAMPPAVGPSATAAACGSSGPEMAARLPGQRWEEAIESRHSTAFPHVALGVLWLLPLPCRGQSGGPALHGEENETQALDRVRGHPYSFCPEQRSSAVPSL